MKITELAIKRPAAMTMVIMFFIVMGLFGYFKIGSDLFPKANVPFVTVITHYPGAGPEEMENLVVDEVEEAVSSISGLKEVRTWIYEGVAFTALEFQMGIDPDVAVADTQKTVDRVMIKLPKDLEKPVVEKFDLNSEPVMMVSLSGDRDLSEIFDLAQDTVKPRLETVPGVASVQILGGVKKQVRVDLDHNKLALYGLSVNQVSQILQAENLNVPSGNIREENRVQYDVRLVGKFQTLDEIKNLPLPLAGGDTIPLRAVADVYQGFQEQEQFNRLDKEDAVGLIINKQSGANVVDTAQDLRRELETVQKILPEGLKMILVDDSSEFINNALDDTKRTLVEGVIMTGLVLFLFLREWRSLVIVMLAIPTSIIATFMMIYFFGYTFNILSLMGLSLCIGILVDDSIVVLENIHRHLKMGKNSIQAAIDGRQEIGMAAVAITLSDVVVFGPIAFMEGMVGQFFRQFGLTVIVAVLFSLFISFTLTPMMAAHLYRHHQGEPSSRRKSLLSHFFTVTGRTGNLVVGWYRGILLWSLNHRLKVLTILLAGVFGALTLIPMIGFEFMSKADQGKFHMEVGLPPGSTLTVTDSMVRELEDRLQKIGEVAHVSATAGASGNFLNVSVPHKAEIQVILKPKRERERSVWEVAQEVRGWEKDYPALDMKVSEAQMVGLDSIEAPIMVEICGPDIAKLQELAGEVASIVKGTPGVFDVSTSWEKRTKPEYQVVIDRAKTARMGLTVAEIAQSLRPALAGEAVTTIKIDEKNLDLWLQVPESDRTSLSDIENISVTNRFGETFLVRDLASVIPARGPGEIRHKNQERMITVLADYQGTSLSGIQDSIDGAISRLNLPHGYSISYDGMVKQMNESNVDLAQALVLSVILVYMILVILYESFLTPFVRMLSLPVGIIGAMLALYLTGNTLNILSLIGIIMLEGLAAKNGTLLIDYTNTMMKRGLNLRDALVEAGTTRLRPIFMTSTTMIFGMLPTALALADGAEIRRPMGIVLIGGLITSTVLTPILLPVAYTLLDDFRRWLRAVRGRLLSS